MRELKRALRIVSIFLFLLGLLVGSCFALHVFGLVVFGIGVFTICLAITRRWANRKRNLLWALCAAAERNMPLAPVVEAHGIEHGYATFTRAAQMAALMRSGHALSVASQSVGGLLPRSAQAPIRLGEQANDLAAGLQLAAKSDRSASPIWFSFVGKVMYVAGCVLFFGCILTFICLKIVPAFECIFADFEMELPLLTQSLIGVASSAAGMASLLFVPFFFMAGLVVLYTLMWCFGAIHGSPPGTYWLLGRFASADIMDALALSIEKNRPVEDSIRVLSESYVDATARDRLRRAILEIEGGRHWSEALRARRVLSSTDLSVLHAAAMNDNLAWALRERAATARRRLEYRLYAALQVAFPAVILVLGTVIGFFVIGLFVPLVTLIEALV